MLRSRALVPACTLFLVSTVLAQGDAPPAPPAELRLSLAQARSTALANDLGLAISELASEAAHFEFEGSWGAFDPVLSAGLGYTDSEQEANSTIFGVSVLEEETIDVEASLAYPLRTGGRFGFDLTHIHTESNNPLLPINPNTLDTITISFRQPLLRGAGTSYSTATQSESELAAKQADERVRQASQQLLLDVETAYWDLVATIDQLGVAEETLQLGREQLDQNQRRLAAGVGTEVEVLQADANVARRIEQRLAREVAVKAAADRLKSLLYPGKDPASWDLEIVPVTELPPVDVGDVPDWQSAMLVALEKRAELRQQRLAIDISELELLRRRSERKVALDFVASSTSSGFEKNEDDALGDAASFEFPRHSARLEFSVPIGNTTARAAERAARTRLRSARLAYDQLESQIVGDVREAVRQVMYQAEHVAAAQSSLSFARRQLAAEEARYREGLSTNFQVLEFQQQLTEALYNETFARASFAKAHARLERALGTLGEARP